MEDQSGEEQPQGEAERNATTLAGAWTDREGTKRLATSETSLRRFGERKEERTNYNSRKGTLMTTYGYVRLSVARKQRDGSEQEDPENIEVQLRKIRGYALQEALPLDEGSIYQDRGVSGGVSIQER